MQLDFEIKYILLAIILLFIPQFNKSGIKYNPNNHDALGFPVNNFITNSFSDFEQAGVIDEQVDRFMAYNALEGAAVAIIKDEKLIYAKGYGFAVKEDSIRTMPGDLFRLASVSKLITGVAIMKLVEAKKLKLNDKVFGEHGIFNDPQYLQIKDPRLKDITILNLLNHSGGWAQRYGDPMFNPLQIAKLVGDTPPATFDTYMKFVLNRNLHFTPGTAYSYSNMGYFFLGKVIERVTKMSYESYVRNNVLFPMGIYDMHLAQNLYEDKFPNEVKYYLPYGDSLVYSYSGDSVLVPKTYGGNDVRLLGAAGGWVASAPELARLIVSIDGFPNVKDALQQESISQMTGGLDHFLGWKQAYRDGWLRTGSFAGTQAVLFRENDGFEWVFLTNTSSWKGASFSYDVIRLMNRIKRDVNKWPERDLFNIDQYLFSSLKLDL